MKVESKDILDWLKLKKINSPLCESPDQAYYYMEQIIKEFEERFVNKDTTECPYNCHCDDTDKYYKEGEIE